MEELALHILDIAQNGLAANATQIDISIVEHDGVITVTIRDNGDGMPEETVKNVLDPFVTSRTTRKVGLGLPLWKQLSEDCNGGFTLESATGQGTTVTAWFEAGHVDLPPLGDMAETIASLVMCNPDKDFRYIHAVGENKFTLDTRELRRILGDVSLGTPDVAVWIKEYIRENNK